jgi:hypothetical protein
MIHGRVLRHEEIETESGVASQESNAGQCNNRLKDTVAFGAYKKL